MKRFLASALALGLFLSGVNTTLNAEKAAAPAQKTAHQAGEKHKHHKKLPFKHFHHKKKTAPAGKPAEKPAD